MNQRTNSVLSYIISHYEDSPISLARFIYIVFLSEWYSVVVKQKTMTDSIWYRRNFGPSSENIIEAIIDLDLKIENGISYTDGNSATISSKKQLDYSILENNDIAILNLAMKHAKELDFISFDSYIENIYPMKDTAINEEIRFLDIAKKYYD